jgi:hypothetical protein
LRGPGPAHPRLIAVSIVGRSLGIAGDPRQPPAPRHRAGSVDQTVKLLGQLDVVVASVHSKLRMPFAPVTERMIAAIGNVSMLDITRAESAIYGPALTNSWRLDGLHAMHPG